MNGRKKSKNVPTIKDVALRAGASISSVSRVINKLDGISEELENNIKQAIAELNYHPNVVARAIINPL